MLKKSKRRKKSTCPTLTVIGRQLRIEGEPITNLTLYRKPKDAPQYITNIGPDISFVVNKLIQYTSSPTIDHCQGITRILKYLRGIMNIGLHKKPFIGLNIIWF